LEKIVVLSSELIIQFKKHSSPTVIDALLLDEAQTADERRDQWTQSISVLDSKSDVR
jgi:hypothetical protein